MAIYSQRMEQCAAGKRLFLEYGIAGRNHGRSFRAVPYLKARCLGADWQRALILISTGKMHAEAAGGKLQSFSLRVLDFVYRALFIT